MCQKTIGGIFVNTMTEYYLESVEALRDLEPTMERMEEEGLWDRVSRVSEPNMIAGNVTGVIHTYRKREGGSRAMP